MPNTSGIKVVPNPNGTKTAILTRTCPFCGKEHSITVKQRAYLDGMDLLRKGALIQNAFPTFTADEREFMLTGICSACWDKLG